MRSSCIGTYGQGVTSVTQGQTVRHWCCLFEPRVAIFAGVFPWLGPVFIEPANFASSNCAQYALGYPYLCASGCWLEAFSLHLPQGFGYRTIFSRGNCFSKPLVLLSLLNPKTWPRIYHLVSEVTQSFCVAVPRVGWI